MLRLLLAHRQGSWPIRKTRPRKGMGGRVKRKKVAEGFYRPSSWDRPHQCTSQTKSRPERQLLISVSVQNLCEAKRGPALAAIGHEADAHEAEDNHRPGG